MAKEWFSTKDLVLYAHLPSEHMVAYLCRTGILEPSLTPLRRRGVARKFSYEDLLLARSVSILLQAGVSVEGLKIVLKVLRDKLGRNPMHVLSKKYVTIVGNNVYLQDYPGETVDLTASGQLAFQFVLQPIDVKVKKARSQVLKGKPAKRGGN